MARITQGSINRKITLTVVLSSGLSLFAASMAFLVYDVITLRGSMASEAAVLADVIGFNSAVAIAFDDSDVATETLGALSTAGEVMAAVIYDATGEPFASFVDEMGPAQSFSPPSVQPPGQTFESGHLDVFELIYSGSQPIGTIFIRWDTQELVTRIQYYATIVAALLAAMSVVAMAMAGRLQRHITIPLTDLVRGAEAIADGDLSTQVTIATTDEIGVLARSFNGMAARLRDLVGEVHRSTTDVGAVSRLLQESSGSMSAEAKRQTSAIADTSNSIERVTDSIQEVNTNVELLARSAYETSASIAEMDASISEVAGYMDHLGESIDSTSSSVNQVASNTDQVVKAVGNLNEATDGTLAHLRQLAVSVQEIKSDAAQSHKFSEDANQEAAKGMNAVNETMNAMREISTSFGQLQGSVSRLSEKSAAIEEIIKVIGDVAEQTSLLSLNAAIIAAQAGEQGRAFSVVAGEVSSLADRTHGSAGEIAKLIRAVQGDTASAVEAVSEGSEKVERGVQRSNMAGAILSQIIEKTRDSTERVHQIVTAAERQSDDLGRVDHAFREVNEIVEIISDSTRDQHLATSEIATAIEGIRSMGLGVRRSTDEQRQGSRLITNAMGNVTEMINQIAVATQAQATSSETIQHALHVFREISDETSSRAEGMTTMVTTLSERSQKLEREIGRFKTD